MIKREIERMRSNKGKGGRDEGLRRRIGERERGKEVGVIREVVIGKMYDKMEKQ